MSRYSMTPGDEASGGVGIFHSLSMSLRRQSRRASAWVDIPITIDQLDVLMACRQSEAIAKLDELGGVTGLCSKLKTSTENGLSGHPDEIAARKQRFGENFIPPPKATPYWKLAWEAFLDTTLLILTASALISIALSFQQAGELPEEVNELGFAIEAGDPYGWIEGAAILAAVIVIVNVTAWNDWQKDRQFRTLQDKVKSDSTYTVIRSGKNTPIKTKDIVVGDICQLKYGDVLPVDGILIHSNDLKIDESSLTGESDLVKKSLDDDVILLSGTRIMEGSGRMVVAAVGLNSQSGKIFSLIAGEDKKKDEKKKSESKENLNSSNNHQFYGSTGAAALTSLTMSVEAVKKNKAQEKKVDEEKEASQNLLQDKVNKITTVLGYMGITVALGTIIILSIRFSVTFFVTYGFEWDAAYLNVYVSYFINGIVILVIAVPEGLPAAVTIALAYSVRRMLEDKNLVRHLYACSTMGNATTICTDKTGTLTTNRMTVVSSYICGRYLSDRPAKSPEIHDKIRETLVNAICVNCGYTTNVQPSLRPGELPVQTGNKTECALLGFVLSIGQSYQTVREQYPESDLYKVYTFNSARKSMSTVVRKKFGNGFQMFTKGAPEILLDKCTTIIDENGEKKPLTKLMITEITRNVIDAMAKMGLRTIAITHREFHDEPNWDNDAEIFSDMTCLAIVGIEDPLRNEVPLAIRLCHRAGVTVRMVTGDNINTATSIAQKCGILPPHENNFYVFDSAEFNRRIRDRNGEVSQEKFDEVWPRLRVLARSSPQDKYTLVKGIIDSHLSEFREVVAVTGDGTNDGPALRKADVGFAMGVTGTEVAKEASDIIVTDDNFSSIVQAIKWGRNVYDSISKFVQFQVTVNIVAVTLASISSIVISTSPIGALQMLWINLIMDTLAALCLATEKPSDDLLQRKPYGRVRPIITNLMATTIGMTSVYQLSVLFTMTFLAGDLLDVDSNIVYVNGAPGVYTHSPTQHFTFVFNTLTMMILFNEFNCRKVHGERNVFTNLHNNYLFISIWTLCLGLQFLIIQFGGLIFETAPLTLDQWMWSFVFGVGSMLWYQVIVTCSVKVSKIKFSEWKPKRLEEDYP